MSKTESRSTVRARQIPNNTRGLRRPPSVSSYTSNNDTSDWQAERKLLLEMVDKQQSINEKAKETWEMERSELLNQQQSMETGLREQIKVYQDENELLKQELNKHLHEARSQNNNFNFNFQKLEEFTNTHRRLLETQISKQQKEITQLKAKIQQILQDFDIERLDLLHRLQSAQAETSTLESHFEQELQQLQQKMHSIHPTKPQSTLVLNSTITQLLQQRNEEEASWLKEKQQILNELSRVTNSLQEQEVALKEKDLMLKQIGQTVGEGYRAEMQQLRAENQQLEEELQKIVESAGSREQVLHNEIIGLEETHKKLSLFIQERETEIQSQFQKIKEDLNGIQQTAIQREAYLMQDINGFIETSGFLQTLCDQLKQLASESEFPQNELTTNMQQMSKMLKEQINTNIQLREQLITPARNPKLNYAKSLKELDISIQEIKSLQAELTASLSQSLNVLKLFESGSSWPAVILRLTQELDSYKQIQQENITLRQKTRSLELQLEQARQDATNQAMSIKALEEMIEDKHPDTDRAQNITLEHYRAKISDLENSKLQLEEQLSSEILELQEKVIELQASRRESVRKNASEASSISNTRRQPQERLEKLEKLVKSVEAQLRLLEQIKGSIKKAKGVQRVTEEEELMGLRKKLHENEMDMENQKQLFEEQKVQLFSQIQVLQDSISPFDSIKSSIGATVSRLQQHLQTQAEFFQQIQGNLQKFNTYAPQKPRAVGSTDIIECIQLNQEPYPELFGKFEQIHLEEIIDLKRKHAFEISQLQENQEKYLKQTLNLQAQVKELANQGIRTRDKSLQEIQALKSIISNLRQTTISRNELMQSHQKILKGEMSKLGSKFDGMQQGTRAQEQAKIKLLEEQLADAKRRLKAKGLKLSTGQEERVEKESSLLKVLQQEIAEKTQEIQNLKRAEDEHQAQRKEEVNYFNTLQMEMKEAIANSQLISQEQNKALQKELNLVKQQLRHVEQDRRIVLQQRDESLQALSKVNATKQFDREELIKLVEFMKNKERDRNVQIHTQYGKQGQVLVQSTVFLGYTREVNLTPVTLSVSFTFDAS